MTKSVEMDPVGTDWPCIAQLLVHLDERTSKAKEIYGGGQVLQLWGQVLYERCGRCVSPSDMANTDWETIRDNFILLPPPSALAAEDVIGAPSKNDAEHFAAMIAFSQTLASTADAGRNQSEVDVEEEDDGGFKIYVVFLNAHHSDQGDSKRLTSDFGLRLEAPHGRPGDGQHDYPHVQFTARPRIMKPSEKLDMAELPESLPAIPVPAQAPLELVLSALICVYSSDCLKLVKEFMIAQHQHRGRVGEAWKAVTRPREEWAVPLLT